MRVPLSLLVRFLCVPFVPAGSSSLLLLLPAVRLPLQREQQTKLPQNTEIARATAPTGARNHAQRVDT
jgi:hypothetical protein